MAPLGLPVVPEVYWMFMVSSESQDACRWARSVSLTSAQTVFLDVNFNDDDVDQPPSVDLGFPGETAEFPTQINGGVIVADGWSDTVTGDRLGGNGDLVAMSEAHAITRFNWLEIAGDDLPSPDSSERYFTVSLDYLLDSTLAGGGQGPGGQQNLFL